MRALFHEDLDRMTTGLAEMCSRAGAAMKGATDALLRADSAAAEAVIAEHRLLIRMQRSAEARAYALLALQAPVARDLRAVVSSLQISADAERMGGLACHIAECVLRRSPDHVLPAEVSSSFADMGRIAAEMGDHAADVIVSCDPSQAARLRQEDDAIDDLHGHVLAVLLADDWEHGMACAIDITLLNRFYERFADHAAEIGRRVIFHATGRHTTPTLAASVYAPAPR